MSNRRSGSRCRRATLFSLLFAGVGLFPLSLSAQSWNVGLASDGTVIEALAAGDIDAASTVMLVGGLDGEGTSSNRVREAVESFRALNVRLIAIPLANPDGAPLVFPPDGVAYRENATANALWRWIGVHAPDRVVIVGPRDYGLAEALSGTAVIGIGRIPAERVDAGANLSELLARPAAPSEASTEIQRRMARSPEQVARELAAVFGHDFSQVTYLPGMALIGRMRLGATDDVADIASRYLDQPPAIRSSLNIAGHLVFAELAERTGNQDYLALARSAADLGFDGNGNMLEAMPFHGEMSDAYFMSTPILARMGRLTGEARYFDMAVRHLDFMATLVLRPDGLYRHSPLTDAAWSRANAFPALGMALTLTDFPETHPGFGAILNAFRSHMETLLPYQDVDGMWHEVIDHPGAYAELSATAMIATAMLRGIRHGWLDAQTYQPAVDAAWQGVLARTGSDGTLVDVCESTNKQPTLEAYLNRAAVLGPDERGGGMMLMFATEMAGME
jgi:unsaturated rhamnogalacturonyl hydrolase